MGIVDVLIFCGKNEIVLGIASLVGILGFLLTVFVSIKTSNINKILKYNQITNKYNKERLGFQRAFSGHQKSILEDEIRTDKLIKDILQQVESYRTKFWGIMPFRERLTVYRLIYLLKRKSNKANWNGICNCLAALSGRLSKREDIRNG